MIVYHAFLLCSTFHAILFQNNNKKTKKWKCKICGYIYEADELPDDFKCPICGVGKEYFELVED